MAETELFTFLAHQMPKMRKNIQGIKIPPSLEGTYFGNQDYAMSDLRKECAKIFNNLKSILVAEDTLIDLSSNEEREYLYNCVLRLSEAVKQFNRSSVDAMAINANALYESMEEIKPTIGNFTARVLNVPESTKKQLEDQEKKERERKERQREEQERKDEAAQKRRQRESRAQNELETGKRYAITSLVLALTTIITLGFTSLISLPFAYSARKIYKKHPDDAYLYGEGMATAGMAISWVVVGLWTFYWAMVITFAAGSAILS